MRLARSESINHKTVQVLELDIKDGSYILKENKTDSGFGTGQQDEDAGWGTGSGSDFSMSGEEGGVGSGKLSGTGNNVYNTTHKLGENIDFKRIVIKDSEITDDTAKIYFFPKGNTSGGKIYIANNKEKVFSISLDSITGRVVVQKEENDYY
jgi:hypothetical protein